RNRPDYLEEEGGIEGVRGKPTFWLRSLWFSILLLLFSKGPLLSLPIHLPLLPFPDVPIGLGALSSLIATVLVIAVVVPPVLVRLPRLLFSRRLPRPLPCLPRLLLPLRLLLLH